MAARKPKPPALAVRASLLAALAIQGAACAGPLTDLAAQVPRAAARGAVQGSAGALADPAFREKVAAILASPGTHKIERELVGGVVDSTLDALREEGRARRIDALAGRAAEGVVLGSVRGLVQGVRDARAGAAVSAAMTEQLGPAMEQTLREDIGPGMAAVLGSEEVQRSLGATARLMGKELVLGTAEGLTEAKPPPEAGSLLSRLGGAATKGAVLFGSAAWVLLLIIAALVAWIVKLLAEAKRYRSEAGRKLATARLERARAMRVRRRGGHSRR